MREIKFRAWHIPQKKMYSAEEMGQDQLTLMPDGSGFANISGISARLSEIDYGKTMIPMQYIGRKDKNGKEIYEGDILRFPDGEFVTVIWMEYPAAFSPMDLHQASAVIGNIYENPELLK